MLIMLSVCLCAMGQAKVINNYILTLLLYSIPYMFLQLFYNAIWYQLH